MSHVSRFLPFRNNKPLSFGSHVKFQSYALQCQIKVILPYVTFIGGRSTFSDLQFVLNLLGQVFNNKNNSIKCFVTIVWLLLEYPSLDHKTLLPRPTIHSSIENLKRFKFIVSIDVLTIICANKFFD